MKKISRIKLNKVKQFLKKLPRKLGEKAFLTFLGLFLFSLILGFFVFFQQNLLIKKEKDETIREPLQFKEKNYQALLETWQEREKKFEEADLKEYKNPFK